MSFATRFRELLVRRRKDPNKRFRDLLPARSTFVFDESFADSHRSEIDISLRGASREDGRLRREGITNRDARNYSSIIHHSRAHPIQIGARERAIRSGNGPRRRKNRAKESSRLVLPPRRHYSIPSSESSRFLFHGGRLSRGRSLL